MRLVLESAMIDIPPGESDYRVMKSYELPVGVDLLSIYPHAHYLGKDLRGYATLPDGSTRRLIHIPSWDFDWQDEYRYVEPVPLPAGTVLTLDFTFDNSADNPDNPGDPPRRVVYGLKSTDEMAQLIFQLLPHDPSERETLVAHAERHNRIQSTIYMATQEVRKSHRRRESGDPDRAIAHYREAMQYRLDHPEALSGLTRAFLMKGDFEAARLAGGKGQGGHGGARSSGIERSGRSVRGVGDPRSVPTAEEALRLARTLGHTALADSIAARLSECRTPRR